MLVCEFQFVELKATFGLLCGVLQGSVLGPGLLLIYINHAAAEIGCHWNFFANDFMMYLHFHCMDEFLISYGVDDLQSDSDFVHSIY